MITENEILHLYERVTEYNALVRYYNRARHQACDEKGNYLGPLKVEIYPEMTAGQGDMTFRVTESIRACLMTHMLVVLDEAWWKIDACARECTIETSRLALEEIYDGHSEDRD